MNPELFLEKNSNNITITNSGYSRPLRANEDWCNKFNFCINNINFTLILVLDGHGCPNNKFQGSILNNVVNDTAKYFCAILYENIFNVEFTNSNIENSIIETHLKLQEYFNEIEELNTVGTCTGGVLIYNDNCIAFNLGDISVVHIDNNGEYRLLSNYHNTKNMQEFERIKDLPYIKILPSGNVLCNNKSISITGALGDSSMLFLNRKPHVSTIKLSKNDKIIVTSDGIIGTNNYGITVEKLAEIVNTNDILNIEIRIAIETFSSIHNKGISVNNTDDATVIFYQHN